MTDPSPALRPMARARLRAATREGHQALHRHPLLRRLLMPDLTHAEYSAASLATLLAFDALETARNWMQAWGRLHLRDQIAALCRDQEITCAKALPRRMIALPTPFHLLGALYVAHGASFGAAVIARSVRAALPGSSTIYYEMKSPETWRALCDELETLDVEAEGSVCKGALAMFDLVRRHANHAALALGDAPQSGYLRARSSSETGPAEGQ